MATIKDVAEKAGVSVMTVSRVINNNKYVSQETREKVEQAMEELGYIPNALAHGLITKKTHVLGLIVSDITNPFFTTIARGVEDTAIKNGFNTILCNSDEDVEKEERYIELLLRKRVEGIILSPADCDKRRRIEQIISRKIPLVLIDRRISGLQIDRVYSDSINGAYELTKYLIDLGHRRIGIIIGPRRISTAVDRVEGYKRALQEEGISMEEELIRWGKKYSREDGYLNAIELLTLEHPPTAIFGGNRLITVGILRAIRELKLRIPDDISVVSFDEVEDISVTNPFLTVISQNSYVMGVVATEQLLERIRGNNKSPEDLQKIVLQPRLVIRKSCGSPKEEVMKE
ncbi:MAG TPA: LacI family DNA-binding transcriptional regulator [bacterium]|nr:LacI family DNA-binding transcriptional regulator [bacterium]